MRLRVCFSTTPRGLGWICLQALGWFVITVLLGLSLHMFGVLLALGLFPLANFAARVFPAYQDCHPDGVFNFVIKRDVADCASSF